MQRAVHTYTRLGAPPKLSQRGCPGSNLRVGSQNTGLSVGLHGLAKGHGFTCAAGEAEGTYGLSSAWVPSRSDHHSMTALELNKYGSMLGGFVHNATDTGQAWLYIACSLGGGTFMILQQPALPKLCGLADRERRSWVQVSPAQLLPWWKGCCTVFFARHNPPAQSH